MHPTLLNKLKQLRRKLTGWVLVDGLGRWLGVLLAVLAIDMAIDRVFKMDLAQRTVMLVVIATVALVYFAWRVIRPLLLRVKDETLLLQVESKNPELKEILISSWQLSRDSEVEFSGVSESLAAATIRSGIAQAENIDFTKSLDLPHHRQNWALLIAGLILTLILGVGITQTGFIKTWFNRNIRLSNDQWPQGTYLSIAGVKDGMLIVPRGSDHRLLVEITENSTVQNVPVSLEIDTPGERTSHSMKPTGRLAGREQAHLLYNVSSAFRFRALGGDDVTEWVEVQLVEPPAVIDFQLTAHLPPYTAMPPVELSGSGTHTILGGSELEVRIQSNKVLQRAVLTQNSMRGESGAPVSIPMTWTNDRCYSTTLSPVDLLGGQYRFSLLDESGLKNNRPSSFSIALQEDHPPKVRARLLGISGLVVPRARLPVSYQVTDDFGLKTIYFDCFWKSTFESPPAGSAVGTNSAAGQEAENATTKKIVFATLHPQTPPVRESDDAEVLDLRPLDLLPGSHFRFSVASNDTRPETPGIGESPEFLLRVVTEEELRADLLRREIEQRQAFEQAYEAQMELASEIMAIAAKRPAATTTRPQFIAAREAELIDLVRNQKSIGTSVARVADRFEEFLVEVKNNRLDEAENELAPDKKIETRFDADIIQPIRELDSNLISIATRSLDHCRRFANEDSEFLVRVDQTSVIHRQTLVEMKKILDAMNDSENFQEVINDLLEIKGDSAHLKNAIEQKLNPKDIFDDPDAGIFDE